MLYHRCRKQCWCRFSSIGDIAGALTYNSASAVSQTLLTWHQCYLRHADDASVRDSVDAVSAAFQTPLEYKSDNADSDHESLKLKGTVQWDCLLPIFSLMDSSQAPYSVFRDFSNLASSQWDIRDFFIDSPLLFISESRYSSYCLLRRVATLRIILAGSRYILELSA
jgi:hypothetical protein